MALCGGRFVDAGARPVLTAVAAGESVRLRNRVKDAHSIAVHALLVRVFPP